MNILLVKFGSINTKRLLCIALFLLFALQAKTQEYVPTQENLAAREWFQEARYGLFIHWGVYSVLGDGEWVMNNQNIAIDAYEKLPTFFNPTEFDAEEWVKLAKDAGMKYITITSRHHDGFSMFDTQATDYNIVKSTPYGKDVLKALADACHKEDIKLFFYYSLLDWHHDDYFPRGRTGKEIEGRATSGEWENYIDFMKQQLTELLTNYGDISGIWLDGHWDQMEWDGQEFSGARVDWHYEELYQLIHDLQPQCLVGNNHHLAPIKGEDFQMFERDLPGHNTTGWATKAEDLGDLPFEVCETINGSWGFNLQDQKHKIPKEVVEYIVKAAGYGSNLLLNVGPMPNGEIQKEHQALLREVGQWMKVNGETIYGTQAGPLSPTDEFSMTTKGNMLYIHLLQANAGEPFVIDGFQGKVKKATYFSSGEKVDFQLNNGQLRFTLDEEHIDEMDTIIAIKLKK